MQDTLARALVFSYKKPNLWLSVGIFYLFFVLTSHDIDEYDHVPTLEQCH